MPFIDLTLLVDIDTRTTTDHLFEQRHGVNLFVDNNQSAGLAIDTCGEQFGSRDDGRVFFSRIDEAIEHLLAIGIIRSDSHDIIRTFSHLFRIHLH